MSRRRVALTALVAAVTLASCTLSGGAADQPSPGTTGTAAPARWTACDDVAGEITGGRGNTAFRFSCATIRVPQDWRKPDGDTFSVALLRARSRDQGDRVGSLLVNPGGPGVSGVELAVYLTYGLPADIVGRFDIVGFDPRGVGRSTRVACIPDSTKDAMAAVDPYPATEAGFAAHVALWRQVGTACGREYGDRLGLFSTEQAARDLDAIRAAVGDPETTYLGYSYGTLLGAVYAQLFPRRIRALVLDGAVDPRAGSVAASEGQARGFERAFDDFAADCRGRGTSCPLGPDPRAALRRVLDRVGAQPLRAPGGRTVTDGHVILAVVAALYSQSQWTTLARALADAGAGDPERVLQLADEYTQRRPDGRYSNLIDANTAINCADDGDRPTVAEARRLHHTWAVRYPLFGSPLALSLLGCAEWPGEEDPYPTDPARGAPPVLVVGTTGDPATPYENTPELARMLGTAVVLTWDGEGHTAYPQTRCVTTAVDAYLLRQDVPRDGLRCPAR